MKLIEALLLPNSLKYHIDNNLTLHENVYRYSSDAFINLFTEARKAHNQGVIQLCEADLNLIQETDIGLYGMFEGQKVPLDLPMVDEEVDSYYLDNAKDRLKDPHTIKDIEYRETRRGDKFIKIFYTYDFVPGKMMDTEPYFVSVFYEDDEDLKLIWKTLELPSSLLNEAEYRGKDVPLNKPKRGGSKKFYVYTKNKKGNVVKVSFGGTTGLNVKIDEPGARASFAKRHRCDTKKDKTKPGYWSCNIGRYWKSLGGKKNFSGYW